MPKLSTYATATPVLTDSVIGVDDPGGTPSTKNFLFSAIQTLIAPRPTRTTVSLTGSTVTQAIPAGVTWFKFTSTVVVVSTSSANFLASLRTGSADKAMSGITVDLFLSTASAASAVTAIMTNGSASGTNRWAHGEVFAPRSSTKKSLSRANSSLTNSDIYRSLIADSATDDDEIRFWLNTGTFSSGSVEIEWFYN